jgi:tripartite-type tricarboxylate transporter receptor subunit TctC
MVFSRRAIIGSFPMLIARAQAQAQSGADDAEWPKRPVRFILSAAAGSAGDDVARLVAARLSEQFRRQFVIDNRPAAGGTLAEQDLLRSTPDGYTIGLLSTSTHVIAKLYDPDLPYDPIKDFAPISLLGSSPYVLAVYPGLPAKNVAELVALARQKQAPLSNAAFGTMSLGYLASVLFAQKVGIRLNQIPYRSSAQAVIDVVAGRVDMQFSTLPPAVPLIREGKLCALATTGAQRFPTLPDTPTLAESGLPDFDVALWLGIAAPAGTSLGIIAKLNSELTAILTAPDMRDAMMRQSFVAEPSSPDALARRISADLEKWRKVVAVAASSTP